MTTDTCPNEFTCAWCHGTFHSGWTHEDAMAEYEQEFPDSGPPDTENRVCDECYPKVLAYAKKHGLM